MMLGAMTQCLLTNWTVECTFIQLITAGRPFVTMDKTLPPLAKRLVHRAYQERYS